MQMHTTGPDPLNKEKFGPNSPDRTQSVDGPDTSNLAQNMLYTAFVFFTKQFSDTCWVWWDSFNANFAESPLDCQ